jgi:hypothetical protein
MKFANDTNDLLSPMEYPHHDLTRMHSGGGRTALHEGITYRAQLFVRNPAQQQAAEAPLQVALVHERRVSRVVRPCARVGNPDGETNRSIVRPTHTFPWTIKPALGSH